MKLLFLLSLVVIAATGVHTYFSKKYYSNKTVWLKPITLTAVFVLVLVGFIFFGLYLSSTTPDTQCTTHHNTNTSPPKNLQTAMDYFFQGNYDYDVGDCQRAIADYSHSLFLNPHYPETYNNRAYTYMRLQDYHDALPDLNMAILLDPNYIQALMNRGDIHNYYYQINRNAAISDYKRVVALIGPGGGNTSVCGHLFLAEHNGWNLGTIFAFLTGQFLACR